MLQRFEIRYSDFERATELNRRNLDEAGVPNSGVAVGKQVPQKLTGEDAR